MFSRSILSTVATSLLGGVLAGSLASFAAYAEPVAGQASAESLAARSPSANTNTNGTIRDIEIEGNQRIEARTILTYLGLSPGQGFNQTDINNGLKNLFATGFFADVK